MHGIISPSKMETVQASSWTVRSLSAYNKAHKFLPLSIMSLPAHTQVGLTDLVPLAPQVMENVSKWSHLTNQSHLLTSWNVGNQWVNHGSWAQLNRATQMGIDWEITRANLTESERVNVQLFILNSTRQQFSKILQTNGAYSLMNSPLGRRAFRPEWGRRRCFPRSQTSVAPLQRSKTTWVSFCSVSVHVNLSTKGY